VNYDSHVMNLWCHLSNDYEVYFAMCHLMCDFEREAPYYSVFSVIIDE